MSPVPHIGIRLDCGPAVGLGHLHRCLPVARALAARGAAVRFVVAGGEPGPERLRRAGFPVDALPRPGAAAFRDWLNAAGEGMDAWLVDVRDDLAAEDVRALRPAVTAVLDDPTDKRLAADFAFYPPVPQVRELDWTGHGGRLLTGFAYVPLDERLFAPLAAPPAPEGAPPALPAPGDGPPALLVTMGGTDPHGLTLLALRAVAAMSANVAATVVVPAACPVRRDCLGLARELAERVRAVDGPTELLPLMLRADLALAAFGTTAYELAALGRPAVLVGLSPDHARAAECLAGPDAAENAGCFTDLAPSALAARLDGLARSPARRAALSRNALALGLGPGAAVIADLLLGAIHQARPQADNPRP